MATYGLSSNTQQLPGSLAGATDGFATWWRSCAGEPEQEKLAFGARKKKSTRPALTIAACS